MERAREIHGLSPTASAALGRTLCGASMLGELMKEEDASLTIRVNGGGPVGSVIAVSDSSGNVRGYVTEPKADLPLRKDGKLDVGGLVGTDGMLTVSRDIGLKEPYVGSTELVTGEIAEDLAQYMVESEQIPAAVGLGVLVDTDRTIKAAGGFIVQLMPGAPEELIAKLEDNILYMDQLTTVLDEDGLDAVPAQVLLSPKYYISGEEAPYALENNAIPLRHGLFDHDAVILCGTPGAVTLKTDKDAHGVELSYPDMNYIAFWHTPETEAPFVCIEPWLSLPSRQDVVEDLEKQPDIRILAPGEVYENRLSIRLLGL